MNTIIKMENCLLGKKSGGDFKTIYTSPTTLTCSELPSYHEDIIDSDILTIVQINSVGKSIIHNCQDTLITVSGNVITLPNAKFLNTDTFLVYTNIEKLIPSVIDPVTIVTDSDIGVSDGVWKDQGSLQKVHAPVINILWDLKVNNSTGNELRVLGSATDGGTLHLWATDAECVATLGDANIARALTIVVGGIYSYIQIQTKAATVGVTEGVISVELTSGWRSE